jgi:hypothetical protein
MSNYNEEDFSNSLEIKEKAEQQTSSGMKVSVRTNSFKSNRDRGKKGRTMWISGIVQAGFVSGKADVMNEDYYTMCESLSSKVFAKLPKWLFEKADDFMVIRLDGKSLQKEIQEYFNVNKNIAQQTISVMRKNKFMKKHDNKTFSFNPYAIGKEKLAGWKLYQLQCHWEMSNDPMCDWIEIDEEAEWESVDEMLTRAREEVKAKLDAVRVEKEDLKVLNDDNRDGFLSALEVFWEFVKPNSEGEYDSLEDYLMSEKGIRHLRSWWLNENSSYYRKEAGGPDLVFTYRKRAEYRKYFLRILKEKQGE